ncbi:hypothetical protein B0A52_09300 [Exophiala mesophila]|uniref:Uncharacterized protein n=1 Tax=Exophiala mesophila TaxID=212818 RepID=A0A438MWI3_EXOME|nr:hypothetical protein B0A52_09300 [Exophiala mesophila]
MAGRQNPKRSKPDESDFAESSTSDYALTYFIPGEDIDTHVLLHYIGTWVDRAAKIRTGRHPTETKRTGFNVTSETPLTAKGLQDIVNDSRDWDNERQTKAFRKEQYPYAESKTAARRAKFGPSGPSKVSLGQSQDSRRREMTTEPMSHSDHVRYQTASAPGASGVSVAQYQPQPQTHSYHGGGVHSLPSTSMPQPGAHTYYNYNYSSTPAPGGGDMPSHHTPTQYRSDQQYGRYSPPARSNEDPPPYEHTSRHSLAPPKQPGQPEPDQPDPAAFDMLKTGSQMMRGNPTAEDYPSTRSVERRGTQDDRRRR